MPSTSLGLPYPVSGDAPNVPQYIQNLAVAANGQLARGFARYYGGGWPNSGVIAGTGNISSDVINVNPGIGPYVMTVSVGAKITTTGTKECELQMWVTGLIKARLSITAGQAAGVVSRSFQILNGAAQNVSGNLAIFAGTSAQSFTDDTHSFVSVHVHAI